MTRFEDWDVRLYVRLEDWKKREFEWAKGDCAAFAGDVIEAMTGTNPWSPWAERYNDERSALEAIKVAGFGALLDVLVNIFGEPIPVSFAQRGDLVYLSDVDELTPQIGICLGQRSVGWGITGALIEVPTLSLEAAWHV